MKYFLSVILLALLLVVFAGCGNQGGNANNDRKVERPIGHGPLKVVNVRGVMNDELSKNNLPICTDVIHESPGDFGGVPPASPALCQCFFEETTEIFSLTMHVTVLAREQRAFDRQYERLAQQIIDSVETIMFAATPEERMEIGLRTIGEKSRQTINGILGTPLVQDVFITKVTVMSL